MTIMADSTATHRHCAVDVADSSHLETTTTKQRRRHGCGTSWAFPPPMLGILSGSGFLFLAFVVVCFLLEREHKVG